MLYKLKKSLKPYNMAIISVFIAIVALNIVSFISIAGKSEIAKEMDGVGLNGMSVSVYNNYNENITDVGVYEVLSENKDITLATPVLYDYAQLTFSRKSDISVMCWGISPMAKDIVNLELVHGKMFTQAEVNNRSNVCLIDESIAESVYGRTNIVGKSLYISMGNGVYRFEIIGIAKKTSNILNSLSGDIIPDFVYIPYTCMETMTYKKNIDRILINVTDENIKDEDILNYVAANAKFYSPSVLKVTNLSQQRQSITNIVNTAFLALFSVSCVAVIVCSISVATGVTSAVSAQQHDIGIKLSLGASRLDIMLEFLMYSVTACLTGIFGGTIIGAFIILIANYVLKTGYWADVQLLLYGIFATIALTVIFSLYPSYQGAKLTPVKALNRE